MESIDKGTFEVGQTVRIGYADQTHKDIDPKKTVYQVISGGQESIRVGGREINARAYLSGLIFPEPIRKSNAECCPEGRETAFIWPLP